MTQPKGTSPLDLMSSRLLLGYARVSTDDQDLTNQRAELHAAGCVKLFSEKFTGTRRDRPELARMLDHLRLGDVVTVTRLDRLARSTRDLLDIAERIQEAGAGLRSLAEPWADTTTPAGRMVLTVFAGIAEFERSLIIDRTRSGREAAKARGVKFGPKLTLSAAQIAHARELIDQEGRTVKEAAALLGKPVGCPGDVARGEAQQRRRRDRGIPVARRRLAQPGVAQVVEDAGDVLARQLGLQRPRGVRVTERCRHVRDA